MILGIEDMSTVPSVGPDHQPIPERYCVLVVDDHELFSTSLVIALRNHGVHAQGVRTVSMNAILATAHDYPGGLIVLDFNLGRDASGYPHNPYDVFEHFRGIPGWKVLMISGSAHRHQIAAAIAQGAIGFVSKSASFDVLLSAVLSVANGKTLMSLDEHRTWLALHRSHVAQERELTRRLDRLSNRERAVLEMLAEGHRAATIATKFMVSLTTVRSQIQSIFSKLGVNSQLEAVVLIRKHHDDGRSSDPSLTQ